MLAGIEKFLEKRLAKAIKINMRYANDIIVAFEYRGRSQCSWGLRERLGKLLSLHPDKTRLIEFGRHAVANRERRGLGKPETFDFSGLRFYLRQVASGQVPPQEENPARPHAGEAASHQAGVTAAQAPADPGPGEMAETGRQRLLQLSRRADQQSGAVHVPLLRHRTLATLAAATSPKRRHDMGKDQGRPRARSPNRGSYRCARRFAVRLPVGAFTGGTAPRRRIAPQALARFKARVRELTRRTRGKSLAQIVKELSVYLIGWRGYFGFCQTPSVLSELDRWLRRRLRAIAWKQWKRGPARFAELRRRGVGRDLAAQTAGSPHGPWRLANSPALTKALPNRFFGSLGLASIAVQRSA